jgi:hypothetical protein
MARRNLDEEPYATPRALHSAIGSHESWSRTTDRTARTAPGREAFNARFEKQVPPEITDPDARARAAEHLRKAYFLRLAAKSARARRLRSQAAALEAEIEGASE